MHGVYSIKGIFHSLDITKAEVHDVHLLKNIKQQMFDCVLLEDQDYLSHSIQLDLFQIVNIKLETPKKANQKDSIPQPYIFKKSRKRIETLFSQLCTSSELETIMLHLMKVLKQDPRVCSNKRSNFGKNNSINISAICQ